MKLDCKEKFSNATDNIYKALVPLNSIKRSNYLSVLNKELFEGKFMRADTILQLRNGIRLSAREILMCSEDLDVCTPSLYIEFMEPGSIRHTDEWLMGIPQLYFVGYINTYSDSIRECYLIDTARITLMLANTSLEELKAKYLQKNISPKRANFLAIPLQDIEKAIFLHLKL